MKDGVHTAWSCGGGIQSVAVGVLVGEGILPVPDLAGIADTGRERRTTWDYLHNVLNPYLRRTRGFDITVVSHSFARVDLFDKDGLTLAPAYTGTGRLGAFCSGEWKRDVMERWLRSMGVKRCVQWLGFSLDEMRRAKGKAHRPWCQPAYPLIDLRMDRQACVAAIERAGLPLPSKSRCWMCPHQNAEEWADVKSDAVDWAKAIEVDEAIRESDPASDVYLHASRVPLAQADIRHNGGSLFQHCEDGGCFT